MKIKYSFWGLLLSTLLLQGCDTLVDTEDTLPVVADAPIVIDPNLPRPSAGAPVITSNGSSALDNANKPILARGINVQFANNPAEGVNSINAIKAVGANTVRIQLLPGTTAGELEAAINAAASQGLVAILTLGDGLEACNNDRGYIESLVYDIWLSKWVNVLAKDKYQPYIMINIANKWGPKNVFDATASKSYSDYIDTYKILIRQFRQAGLNAPLVIDAPGCGEDHNAFLGGRATELLAADPQQNIILSVHAHGSKWKNVEKAQGNITDLQQLAVPFIISEFGGSNVQGSDSVDHVELMNLSMGNKVLVLDLPWTASDNHVAYAYSMAGLTSNIIGSAVSFDVFLAQGYIDDGSLTMQVYFEDVDGNIAKMSAIPMIGQIRNKWNRNRTKVESMDSFELIAEGFDESQIGRVGIQFNANGKPIDVGGTIRIDNVSLDIPPGAIYTNTFADGKGGWDCKGWLGEWNDEVCVGRVDFGDQLLSLNPPWNSTGSDGKGIAIGFDGVNTLSPAVDLERGFEYSFDLFVPDEYKVETGIVVQPFLNDSDWTFKSLAYLQASSINFGGITTVSVIVNNLPSPFITDKPPARLGVQIFNIATPKTEAITFDNVVISDLPIEKIETIYEARFTDAERWSLGGGAGEGEDSAIEQTDDGYLAVLPTWGGASQQTQPRYDAARVLPTPIDPSLPLTISFDVFIPQEYSTESSMYVQAFMNGADWTGFAAFGYKGVSGLTLGAWNSINIPIDNIKTDAGYITDDFNLEKPPVAFGVQLGGVTSVKTEPVLIDNYKVTMDVGSKSGKKLLELNFEDNAEIEGFGASENVDLSQSVWLSSFTANVKTQAFGIKPFGWIAWVWKDDSEGGAALSLSQQYGTADLTQRGEEVVNGLSGIGTTAIPVSFPAGYQANASSSLASSISSVSSVVTSSSSSTTSSVTTSSSTTTTSSSTSSASSSLAALIVSNGGLEDGDVTNPWRANTGDVALALSAEARSANNSLLVSGRTSTWHAAGQDIVLQAGKSYDFSVWVKLAGADAKVSMSLKKTDDSNDGEASYKTITSVDATATAWTRIKGTYNYEPTGTVSELFLYVESADATASYYLDDLVVFERQTVTTQVTTINGDLEEGGTVSAPWSPWTLQGGDVAIELSTDEFHGGGNSLLVTGRSAGYHGQVYPLTPSDFVVGQDYTFSVWVKMASGEGVVKLSSKLTDDDGDDYGTIASETLTTASGWVELTGAYTHAANGEVTWLSIYIESEDEDASYYVDDLSIVSTVNLDNASGLSAGKPKFLGNIIASSVPTDFNSYWNQVTPENAGKWGSVENIRDVMNWDNLDLIYAHAKANNMPFKLHVLVWGSQEPAWMSALVAAEAWTEIAAEVEEWIAAAAARYPDTDIIDVVNEAQAGHAPATYREALGGAGTTGWDWIVWSFEKTRQYFPNAQLHLNDYGIINSTSAITTHREIAQILKDKNLIDGLAIQAHQFSVDQMSAASITANLDELAKTGLPIYISELDITGLADPHNPSTFDANSSEQENRQEARYKEVFPALWEHSAVKGVTLWGYRETATWKAGTGIQNADGSNRKALTWLQSYFAQ